MFSPRKTYGFGHIGPILGTRTQSVEKFLVKKLGSTRKSVYNEYCLVMPAFSGYAYPESIAPIHFGYAYPEKSHDPLSLGTRTQRPVWICIRRWKETHMRVI